MRNFNRIAYCEAVLLLLAVASCSPEDGLDGEMGLLGITGADGGDGYDVQDGMTDIFASDWIEPSFSIGGEGGWITREDFPSFIEFFAEAPELTVEILNTGILLVYAQVIFDDSDVVRMLPFNVTFPLNFAVGEESMGDFTQLTISPIFKEGAVGVQQQAIVSGDEQYNLFEEAGPAPMVFRYVIIPNSSATGKKNAIDYKKMSYKEIVSHFGLQE